MDTPYSMKIERKMETKDGIGGAKTGQRVRSSH